MAAIRSMVLTTVLSSAAIAAAFVLLAGELSGAGTLTCDSIPSPPANSTDLDAVLRDLIAMDYLAAGIRALCVGPRSCAAMKRVGFSAAVRSSATRCCGLHFEDDSFDFALAASLDRARVPARVVLEMERVIRPGRLGVVVRTQPGPVRPDELMKVTAPVASLLRLSDVVGVRAVNGSATVVFRKRGPVAKGSVGCCDEVTSTPFFSDGIVEFLRASLIIGGRVFWSSRMT